VNFFCLLLLFSPLFKKLCNSQAAFETPLAVCFVTELCPGGDVFWQLEHTVKQGGKAGIPEAAARVVLAEVRVCVCVLHPPPSLPSEENTHTLL